MATPDNKKEQTIVLTFLAFFMVGAIIIVFNTDNSFGGGDHFTHFKLAYWGWKYPRLLFSHWGKPVYTLLVSPFARLGMNYARLYNVLAGTVTAFLAWRLSLELKLAHSRLVVLFVLFTPVYFILMFTALTEITFSLFLVLSLLLFFREKYIWSAVVISFLPLIRTESIVLLPVFLLAFGLKKQWKALPFFATGFLLISFSGMPFHKSFWWLITEMPYKGNAAGIYGHGTLFHFIHHTRDILGYPLAGLFCIGFVFVLWAWAKQDHFKINRRFYFLLLIPGSYLLYLSAHSYVWWKGIGNSLGLIRVIGAVTPLAAITALSGFDVLMTAFAKYKKTETVLAGLLVLWIVAAGVKTHSYGFKKSPPQKIVTQACRFLKVNHLDRFKIYYFSNYVPYELGMDPYDSRRASWGLPRTPVISDALPDSSIIVWDAHFGPNEGGVPLEKLLNDKGLQVLNIFRPKVPFKVLGGYDYVVYIFQKKKPTVTNGLNISYTFEKNGTRNHAFSGKRSYFLAPGRLYFNLLEKNTKDFCTRNSIITVSGEIYPVKKMLPEGLLLVFSREVNGKSLFYKTFSLAGTVPGRWNHFVFDLKLMPALNAKEVLKVYFWNKGKTGAYLDNIRLNVSPVTG